MKPLTTMKKALQDIVARSFGYDANKITDIRKIAMLALHDHKKDIPEPEVDCPRGFQIGAEYGKYPACERCMKQFSQVCSIYNYIWYTD